MKHIKEFKLNELKGPYQKNLYQPKEDRHEASSYKERLLETYGQVVTTIQNMSEEQCMKFHKETTELLSQIYERLGLM
jgi:hypothetical protein